MSWSREAENVLRSVIGAVIDWMISAVLGRYCAKASVGAYDQLGRLRMQVIMLNSVVEQAERVQIRSRSLSLWLSRLRAAALDGDEVLQWLMRRAVVEKASARDTLWNAVKKLMFGGDDEVSRAVARLDKVSSSIGDFLKLLKSEIWTSMPAPPPPFAGDGVDNAPARHTTSQSRTVLDDGSELGHAPVHTGCYRQAQNIRRAFPTSEPDTDRLRHLVIGIRAVVQASNRVEVHGSRWLARWCRELQAIADRADGVLLALPAPAPPSVEAEATAATSRDELRRTAQSLETAAAHLENFVTLVRFIVMDRASPG